MSLLPPGPDHHVFTRAAPMFATANTRAAPYTLEDKDHPSAWFLLPQFLLLPTGHSLPIGLLLDPKATTLDLLRDLILERTPPDEQHRVDWIDNPLIEAWLQATAADTTHFCMDLEESDFIFEQVDEVCEHATKLQMIQQSLSWTLTQHLFADAVLASATKSMGGRFTKCFTACLDHLRASYLSPFPFGPIDDIFSLAFWPHLRPPSIKSWLDEHLFNTFRDADPMTMPHEIANFISTDIVVSPSRLPLPFQLKAQPRISTPLASPEPPSDLFGMCCAPGETSTPSKRSSSTPSISSALGKCPNPTSVPPASIAPVLRPPGSVTFAGSSLSTSNSTLFDAHASITGGATAPVFKSWFTPAELSSGDACPTSSSADGPALHTALAQFAPHKQTNVAASLRFSRDLLLDQSVTHAKLIAAYTPWGAYRLEDSVKLISNTDNKLFPLECNNIPGHIGLAFSQAVLPAIDKSSTITAVSDFQRWVKFQCTDAHMPNATGPVCHINPAFWVQNTSRALLSLTFKSGRYCTSPPKMTAKAAS